MMFRSCAQEPQYPGSWKNTPGTSAGTRSRPPQVGAARLTERVAARAAGVWTVARSKPAPAWTNTFSGPTPVSPYTSRPTLLITEIMYHPFPPPPGSIFDTEDFQYLELNNLAATPLNVNRFNLSGGVTFQFP